MENKRVLFVAPSAYPLGGVPTWLDYLLPGIESLGWEPTLGLVAGKHHDPDRYLAEHPFHRVTKIHNLTGSQEGRVRALGKAISRLDPAIMLSVNIPDTYIAQARLRNRKKSNSKTVMALHGIQADLFGDAYRFRSVLDAVICTNRLVCELVEEVSAISSKRILYAPCGVDIAHTPRSREENAGRDAPLRIAWVGRFEEEQKRISDIRGILEALDRQSKSFELWLVGGGPDEGSLRSELGYWLARDKVCFLGELPRERVLSEVYPQADCLLLTSEWETGPIVIWEALAAGLPVVTSSYLGLGPEGSLVHGENCLIFPIGEAEAAAKCICSLDQRALREKLSSHGRALVSARYSIQASVGAWHDALTATLAIERNKNLSGPFKIQPSGRLDYIFGVGNAEYLRQLVRRRYLPETPGAEWPHSISKPRSVALK